jgi:GntR family transcriptional regulator, transcriptional repressor for pyruvate dehydrogenase complex
MSDNMKKNADNAMFSPIPRGSVSDEVIQQIKERIERGLFKPGERLPSEISMARSLNVGRSTIREALKVFVHLGILERTRRQTVVARNPFRGSSFLDVIDRCRSSKDVVEMTEIRRFLEIQICELAAERADDDDLRSLKDCLDQMSVKTGDQAAFIEADQRFHFALSRAAKNNLLFQMMEGVRKVLDETVAFIIKERPGIIPRSLGFHEEIFKAVQGKFLRKARKAMKDHLHDVESEFGRILMDRE